MQDVYANQSINSSNLREPATCKFLDSFLTLSTLNTCTTWLFLRQQRQRMRKILQNCLSLLTAASDLPNRGFGPFQSSLIFFMLTQVRSLPIFLLSISMNSSTFISVRSLMTILAMSPRYSGSLLMRRNMWMKMLELMLRPYFCRILKFRSISDYSSPLLQDTDDSFSTFWRGRVVFCSILVGGSWASRLLFSGSEWMGLGSLLSPYLMGSQKGRASSGTQQYSLAQWAEEAQTSARNWLGKLPKGSIRYYNQLSNQYGRNTLKCTSNHTPTPPLHPFAISLRRGRLRAQEVWRSSLQLDFCRSSPSNNFHELKLPLSMILLPLPSIKLLPACLSEQFLVHYKASRDRVYHNSTPQQQLLFALSRRSRLEFSQERVLWPLKLLKSLLYLPQELNKYCVKIDKGRTYAYDRQDRRIV